MKTDGKEIVYEQGGVIAAPMKDITKTTKKTGKAGFTGAVPFSLPANVNPKCTGVGGVVGGVTVAAVGGSMVVASVVPSGKKQVMAAAKSGKDVLEVTAPPQPCKASSTQKPSRRRKPTPKVAEILKQQVATDRSTATNLSAPPLQDSDFDSSDEDTLMPFLDSSLSGKEQRPSQDSTSSWQSSNWISPVYLILPLVP